MAKAPSKSSGNTNFHKPSQKSVLLAPGSGKRSKKVKGGKVARDQSASSSPGQNYPDINSAQAAPFAAVVQCREAYSRDHEGHTIKMYRALTTGFAAAWTLERDRREWASFVRSVNSAGLRSKPLRRDKDHIHCFSIVIELIFKPSHGYGDAKRKSRAMEYLCLKGYKPAHVALILKQKGLAGILKEAERQLRLKGLSDEQKAKRKADFRKEQEDPSAYLADLNDDDDVKPDEADGVRISKGVISAPSSTHLVAKANDGLLSAVLCRAGEEITVVLKNHGANDDGTLSIEVLDIIE